LHIALFVCSPITVAEPRVFKNENGLYGFKNYETGKINIPADYEYADNFSEGIAWVITNNKYCGINESGKIIVQCIDAGRFFSMPGPFSEGVICNNK